MRPRITEYELRQNRTLITLLEDGRAFETDLNALIAKGGVFRKLCDDGYYRRARITDGGRGISWPKREIDIGVDGILADQAVPIKCVP